MASAFGRYWPWRCRNSRTLDKLQESEERYRAVAESASDAIISGDRDGNVIYWNMAAERIFGYSADEIAGGTLLQLVPERFRAANRKVFLRARESESPYGFGRTYEQAGVRKDGTEFPVELSFAPWNLAGEMYFTVIVRDISERKKAEEALRLSEERYRRLFDTVPDVIYRRGPRGQAA